MVVPILQRLDARDRALYLRHAVEPAACPALRLWIAATHLGGARATVLAILVPLLVGAATGTGPLISAALACAAATVVSHLCVQVVKRSVGRPRPSRACLHGAGGVRAALVEEPDRFSFPSGHACAAMTVAASYVVLAPSLAIPLLVLASLVGLSRVRLGVHYLGDVLAGQLIAIAAAAIVHAWPGV